MEAIANGPLPQLFALMMVPIIAALVLGGFLIFFTIRRRKKPEMKHGIHSSKSEEEETTDSDEPPADELEVNANVLSSDIPAAPSSSNQVTTSVEDKLDLGLLGKSIEPEVTMEHTSKPTDQEPIDLAARLTPPPADTPPASQATEPVELLRLLRDPQSGQFIVEIAAQRYDKLASVTDKKIGQYILKVTAHLLAFTNGVIITDAGMKSIYNPKRLKEVPMPIGPSSTSTPQSSAPPTETPPAPPQKTEPDLAESSPSSKPSPETGAKPLDSLQGPQPPPPKPSSPQSGGLLGRVAQPAPPPPSLPGLNLAEEINDIVQARLRYSPLAGNNQIEITSDYHGGIRIEVNAQFYDSPDDVPDPDVKELIKASIKEWERK